MPDKLFFVTLKNRGLIKISGTDRLTFLQGLISNDIEKLKTQPILYACLLTPQGKFLHDFFITQHGEELWLDCEGSARTEDLAKRLTTYKLRADINIQAEPENTIYAISDKEEEEEEGAPDPRHPDMGFRSFERPDLPEHPFEEWDARRIALTIPDGSRDMIIDKSTLLECNIDKLHGIDFNKGCYIGQEITARMHYRGLAKKHLYTIPATLEIPKGMGELRSSSGTLAIALLKDSFATNLQRTTKI